MERAVIPHNLPDYVERGGRQVWRPPYTARKAKLLGFVLGADRAAIDALLHRDLVEPAGGAVDYRCAHDRIAVIFASVERLASGDARDRLRGYLSEFEVSVWCLAADVSAGSRLVWYLPYVFVDSGQASASGREVYGYPKQIGIFDAGFHSAVESGGTTTVEALSIDPYAPDTKAVPRPMIAAEQKPGGEQVVASGTDAFTSRLFTLFADQDPVEVDETLPFGPGPQPTGAITPIGSPPPSPAAPSAVPAWAASRVLDTLLGRDLVAAPDELIGEMAVNPTLVFLKQFRDATCPTKACYQAIVEAPLSVDPVTASYDELDPGRFEVTLEDYPSHPIASELGLQGGSALPPEAAFRATLDFDIELGLEVWRAPT
jgi:hypothetical protein